MANFIGPRKRLADAMHHAPTEFRNHQAYVVEIPGLPLGRNFVCGLAEQSGWGMPAYTAAEIAKVFFNIPWSQPANWLYRRMLRCGNPEPGDPYYFTPRADDDSGAQCWTLADVERMIRFLSREGVIDGDRFLTSMWLVLWTAKGYGIYA